MCAHTHIHTMQHGTEFGVCALNIKQCEQITHRLRHSDVFIHSSLTF